MPQIINEGPSIGALFGQGFGQGFGTGLERLAQHKLNQVLQRQQSEQTSRGLAALGIPEQQAQQIAMLPPELQSVVVKNYLQGAESAGLDQALQGVLGTGAQEVQQEEQNGLQELRQQQATQQAPPQRKLELTGKDALLNAIEEIQGKKQPQAEPGSTRLGQPKAAEFKDVLLRPRLSPEHKLKVAALQQQRQMHKEKLSAKEQEEVSKETKPAYDEINKHARAARENNIRLDRMEQLIKEGKLDNPVYSSAIDAIGHGIFGAGIDLSALQTADSQEFKKLSSDFVKSAKDYFGSRLTDTDLKTFLKTVPNLSQTDEGKQRVINNLRKFNDIAILKRKAADEVIKENGGRRPRNFDELVDEKIDKQVDEIARQFKAGIDASQAKSNDQHHSPLVSGLTNVFKKLGIGR